jgi:hypothetical protein
VGRRKGCLVGCAIVLGLFVIYPLWLLANIVIPLSLGFLFPWEPPRAEGAPNEAVLRVMVPEGETYRIEWGAPFSKANMEGETVDPELGYRDYPVREEATREDAYGTSYDISIYAGDEDAYGAGDDEVPLGAILFVSGEYAECDGGRGRLQISWRTTPLGSDAELGPAMTRMVCGSHRYAPL